MKNQLWTLSSCKYSLLSLLMVSVLGFSSQGMAASQGADSQDDEDETAAPVQPAMSGKAPASTKAAKPAKSDEGDSGETGGHLYVGGGLGQFFPNGNEPNHGNLDNTLNYIITVGYEFTRNLAVEYDYTEPVDNQNGYNYTVNTTTPPSTATGGFEMRTQSLFGVFRTSGDIYFKGKLGAVYKDFSTAPSNRTIDDCSGISPAAGIGVGVTDGKGLLEVEYTLVKNDFVDIGEFSFRLAILF